MTRTLGVAGGFVLAALLYVLYVQFIGVAALQPVAMAPASAGTAPSADATALDATSTAIEDLAAWPAAAGR